MPDRASARADGAGDAALVSSAQAGDLSAFGLLVQRYQSAVRQQLARLTRGDLARADDLAQQTFLQAWRGLSAFRSDARVGTWLYRIAYIEFLQDERRRKPALSIDAASEPVADDDSTATGDAFDASTDPRAAQALQIDLARALDLLPEAERVAIVHCFQLDLSHEEAAAVLGMPLGTLKSHIARGKARLRERLAAWRAEEVR